MPSGVVLVIEDDEWVSRLLASAIREAGYQVLVCDTAEGGLSTACQSEPECIVCDIDLPDHDGYWVARNVRTQPSLVSVTPFLFLSSLDDQESRLEGFHVGADVYMTKPFRVGEVVAQIGALVQMASRLRHRRDSLLSIPEAAAQTAIEGDLSQMSIATVLTVLEMERRSGVFEVSSKKRRAQLDIAGGCILHGTVGGTRVSTLAALRTMLAWKVGRFSFAPAHREPPTTRKSIAAYLLEATRLEDERAYAELDLPPSRRRPEPRLATTALGGPRSTPEDVAPPSSRAPLEALDRHLLRAASPAPGTFTAQAARVQGDEPVSFSEGPPSFDLSFELEPVPPSKQAERGGEPPSLRSLARSMSRAPPAAKVAGASRPPPLPLAPPRRATLPPPPLPRLQGAVAPQATALPRDAASKPALIESQDPPRSPVLPPPPPRPPRPPPRPETTQKKR